MAIIKIKNKEFDVAWNAAAMFRFTSKDGRISELSHIADADSAASGRAFFNIVLLVWSMLQGEAALEYPTPESLAALLLPPYDNKFFDELASVIDAGNAEMQLGK